MKIVLASQNIGKLKEMKEILREFDLEVMLPSELGIDDQVEENGVTFAENAQIKSMTMMKRTGMIAIADDSGLVVDKLGGAPGVYSARYGADQCVTDRDRYELLLRNMEHFQGDDRRARFVCCISCATPEGRILTASGRLGGYITKEPKGEGGFGYDPVFYIPELGKTAAELTPEEKNRVSHRGRALRRFVRKLRKISEIKEQLSNANK